MRVWVIQTGEPVQTDNGDLRAMRGINLTEKPFKKKVMRLRFGLLIFSIRKKITVSELIKNGK